MRLESAPVCVHARVCQLQCEGWSWLSSACKIHFQCQKLSLMNKPKELKINQIMLIKYGRFARQSKPTTQAWCDSLARLMSLSLRKWKKIWMNISRLKLAENKKTRKAFADLVEYPVRWPEEPCRIGFLIFHQFYPHNPVDPESPSRLDWTLQLRPETYCSSGTKKPPTAGSV